MDMDMIPIPSALNSCPEYIFLFVFSFGAGCFKKTKPKYQPRFPRPMSTQSIWEKPGNFKNQIWVGEKFTILHRYFTLH